MGKFCYGHYSALIETPLCLNHLSPPENLVTGSSQLSPLLSWSSAEESLLMHIMPPPRDSPHPTSGSGRGIKAQAFASIPENSDGPPSLRGPTQLVRAFIITVLQPTSLSAQSCVLIAYEWSQERSPQTSFIQISIPPEFTSLGAQPGMLLSQMYLVDTLCLCLCTVMG